MKTETLDVQEANPRKALYDIAPLIVNRWSPRSMTGETLDDQETFALFEAARWAPSSFNAQLWRFIIARRQNKDLFDQFVQLLVPNNQSWAKNAALLAVVISRTRFEHNDKPAATHAFDAGAAWENLALEASRRGLVAHGMQGFDDERAKTELGIPADYDVHAMIAIGRRGKPEALPEKLRAAEKPNERRPLSEIVFDGVFGRPVNGL